MTPRRIDAYLQLAIEDKLEDQRLAMNAVRIGMHATKEQFSRAMKANG